MPLPFQLPYGDRRYVLDEQGVPLRISLDDNDENYEKWIASVSEEDNLPVVCDELIGDCRVLTTFLGNAGPYSKFEKEEPAIMFWKCRAYKQGKNTDKPIAEASISELRECHKVLFHEQCSGNAYHAQRMQAAMVMRISKFNEMGASPNTWNWAAYT